MEHRGYFDLIGTFDADSFAFYISFAIAVFSIAVDAVNVVSYLFKGDYLDQSEFNFNKARNDMNQDAFELEPNENRSKCYQTVQVVILYAFCGPFVLLCCSDWDKWERYVKVPFEKIVKMCKFGTIYLLRLISCLLVTTLYICPLFGLLFVWNLTKRVIFSVCGC